MVIKVFLSIFSCLMFIASPVVAMDGAPGSDALQRINVAGKQRMLSQRIARAACFDAIGVAEDRHLEMRLAAMVEFDRARQALRLGDESFGLVKETVPEVLDLFDALDAEWPGFHRITDLGADHVWTSEDFATLLAQARKILSVSNQAVSVLETEYVDQLDVPELTRLVNVAGRQRMLTQKATLEFCLVVSGLGAAGVADDLRATVVLFDRSLAGLRVGNDDLGLIGAPSVEIEYQLELVAELWAPVRAVLLSGADGSDVSGEDLVELVGAIDVVLREANEAVTLYEQF